MRLACSAAALLIILGAQARADSGDACSCKNLTSLQQEVENADYEKQFFTTLSERLKAIEAKQVEVNKDPTNPDSGRSVLAVSGNARKEIMAKEFRLPHDPPDGYTGPKSVDLDAPACEQDPEQLKAMRNGSACKAIADITLSHEAAHTAKCKADTPAVYWDRLPSALAAEEAERYTEQAKAMRAELKRVVDGSTVRVSAIMEPHMTGPRFDVTYSYVMYPFELSSAGSGGGGLSIFKGDGKQAGTIKRVKLAGMSCTPSGQLNDDISMTMETDGFTMGMKQSSHARPGDVRLKCKHGSGMSLRPQSDSGSGPVFQGEPLQLSSTITRNVADMSFAKLLRQGGFSVDGKQVVTVDLVCPGQ
ncbi:hypothetical protein [Aestuariivirga sp.]|uniref:hypothetical protein n=1 Tax=Aestuariivirga sp. TaxID=2650926 RepID=UPI0039E4F5AF